MPDGSQAWRRLMEYLDKNRDAFNNDITDRTNVLDLPAHYPYSPERWTLSVDGTRQLIQYGDVAQYNHTGDRHELSPAAGETVVLESAERPRYVVAYELESSFSFALNQELSTGDHLRIGVYDGSDGWYFEQDGSHESGQGDFVLERAGTEVYRNRDRDIAIPSTQFGRLALQTAWYDITRQKWGRSFSQTSARERQEGEYIQKNPVVDTGGHPGENGTRTANLPAHFEITASGTTTDLVLDAGSAAQVNLGKTTQFNRSKKFFAADDVTVTDAWEPVRAFRIDPDRGIVNVQLSSVSVGKFSTNADIELLLLAGDPSNVLDANGNELDATDFSVPPEASEQNSVLEETTAVEQFPDSTGTPQTSMVDPGGWQLARSELLNESGNQLASTVALDVEAKRPIYTRDYAVVLLKSGSTGTVKYQIQTEQDW